MNATTDLEEWATSEFEEYFGEDENLMRTFQDRVLGVLTSVHSDHSKVRVRVQEILDVGYDHASDLERYLDCACIAEDDPERTLTYEEQVRFLGYEPPEVGQVIYHFSEKPKTVGDQGHPAMCLTNSDDPSTVVADSLDDAEHLFRNHYIVKNPEGIVCHDAYCDRENRDELIDDIFVHGGKDTGWFIQLEPGSVECIAVDNLY